MLQKEGNRHTGIRRIVMGALILGSLSSLMPLGCGGGSSGGGAPSSGSGGTLTFAQRSAAMAAISQQYTNLPHQDVIADNQALLTYVQSRPEFDSSGLYAEAGTIWAHFRGGQTLLIVNNQPYTSAGRAVPPPLPPTRAANQVPSGRQAFLFNTFSAYSPEYFTADAALNSLSTMLGKTGYNVQYKLGSVNNLKTVKSADVLYINGHGTYQPVSAGPGVFAESYCLPTSTGITAVDDIALAGDLGDGSVGPALVPELGTVGRYFGQYYYITPTFVNKYWRFNPNSVVFLNTCVSNALFASLFRAACLNQKASVYVGWDACIRESDSINTAAYLLNSLAGQNPPNPLQKTPPQRPFDWNAVLTEMASHPSPGQTYDLNAGFSDLNTGIKNNLGFLKFSPGASADVFGMLAPSIESLFVDEGAGQLILTGLFGNDPGASNRQVTINGAPLTVASSGWTPTQITCVIPATGANSAGNVQVTVNNHASNSVALTAWQGTFTYTAHGGNDGVANPLFQTVQSAITVRLRADIHSFRDVPNSTPSGHYTRTARGVGTFTWNFQGQQTYGDGSHSTLQGSGQRSLDVKTPLQNPFTATFDIDKMTVSFLFNLVPTPSPTIITTDANGKVTTTHYGGIVGTSAELAAKGQFPMATLLADGTIQGKTINFTTPAVGGKTYQTSLTWSGLSPTNPPDPNAARSARPLSTLPERDP